MAAFMLSLVLALTGVLTTQGQPVPEWGEERPLRHGHAIRGTGHLALSGTTLHIGEPFTLDLRFTATGGGHYLFNPLFDPLLPYPAAIALFDDEHRYVGDLLARSEIVSRRDASARDWVYVPGGGDGYIGATFTSRAGVVPASPWMALSKPLRPGTYYVQAISHNAFIGVAGDRQLAPEDGNAITDNYDARELFRSNRVEITLLPPKR